jgi:hypothetical protein
VLTYMVANGAIPMSRAMAAKVIARTGVDIYGTFAGKLAGIQCKGRRHWPIRQLKTTEIDAAVNEAKQFKPALTTFVIATTAPVQKKLQDHARAISTSHDAQGLFAVHIIGWEELTRKLTIHDDLVAKHFPLQTLSKVHDAIAEIPQRTADLLAQHPRIAVAAPPSLDTAKLSTNDNVNLDELQGGITEAVERDFASRYMLAMRRLLFPEANRSDALQALARELLNGSHTKPSPSLRRRILLRAARSSALRGEMDDAQRFLRAGQALQSEDSDLPAQARLAEARGEIDTAIQFLRDQNDPDSLSTRWIAKMVGLRMRDRLVVAVFEAPIQVRSATR